MTLFCLQTAGCDESMMRTYSLGPLFSLCYWVGRKQASSNPTIVLTHHNNAPSVLKLCYNRLHLTAADTAYLLISQQFITDSMDNIDLAVHNGNRLTQALLFENASNFFS